MEVIEAYLGQDVSRGLTIIFVCCVLVVAAALLDMWTGVDAARANRERIRSHSLRKTVRKVIDYLRIVMFGCLIDILGRKRSSAAEVLDMVRKIIECVDEKDARKLIALIRDDKGIKGGDNGDDQ